MKKVLTILFLFRFLIQLNAQHSAIFSQYQINGLILNPGYAGSQNALCVTGSYRYQWASFKGAPITKTISIHSPLSKNFVGGLSFINDAYGVSSNNQVNLIAGIRHTFLKTTFTLGVQFSYMQLRNNYSDLYLNQSDDPSFADGQSLNVLKAGAGLYIQNPKYFLGFSIPDFQLNKSFRQLKII